MMSRVKRSWWRMRRSTSEEQNQFSTSMWERGSRSRRSWSEGDEGQKEVDEEVEEE